MQREPEKNREKVMRYYKVLYGTVRHCVKKAIDNRYDGGYYNDDGASHYVQHEDTLTLGLRSSLCQNRGC
jgi:hypothetical protein